MKKLKTYWPYILLSLIILGPLLLPGYILTMDMVFVPHPPLPGQINASYPFYAAMHFLSYVIPGDILQKLVLLAILTLCGVGMHRLLQYELPKLNRWVIIAASVFYTVNPFVYERLMMGQFAVIAGYSLLPFFIVSFQQFLHGLDWRQLTRVVGWLLVISVVSIHSVAPAIILAALMWIVGLWRHRGTRFWLTSLTRLAIGTVAIVVISGYWLIPTILGTNQAASAIGETNDLAFKTQGNAFAIMRLEGFWAEDRGLFAPAHIAATVPIIWQLLVWLTAVVGGVMLWRRYQSKFVLYIGAIVIGIILAFTGIPFLGGAYREPHKFVMLVAIGLTVCAAAGANRFFQIKKLNTLAPIAIAIPWLLSPAMLWGFSGQLSVRQYPPEWYALDQKLHSLPDNKSIIFVPWHLYQRFSFSPRIVAHPAATFFGRPISVSDDPEFAGVHALKNDPTKEKIAELLRTKPNDIAMQLGNLNVGYVIFANEPGYEDVEFIRHAAGMHQVFKQGTLELYRVGGANQ